MLAGRIARVLARLWPQRLAGQTMAAVVLVLWLSIAGFGLYAVRTQGYVASAALDAQAASLAQNLALAAEAPLVLGDLDTIARLIRRAAEPLAVREIAVFDAHGQRLSHAVRDQGQPAQLQRDGAGLLFTLPNDPQPQARRDSEAARVTAWHPVQAGAQPGWVRVDLSTASVDALSRQLRIGTLAACLLAGLCATLALRAVLAGPLHAIEQARDFADGLQQVEGQQLPASGGPRETRELAASLNRASASLLQMRQAMDASLAHLRRHEAALVDTNEQLRTIFALSPDALICFDDAGRVSYTNPAFHRITGLAIDKVLGFPAAALDMRLRVLCAEAAEFPGLDGYFDAGQAGVTATVGVTQAGSAAGGSPSRRLTLLRPQFRVLEVVGALSEAPSVRRLLYLRDITHESEVDRMKSEFLSMAAHELRTPMTSIHACIELMLARDFAPPRRQQMLGVMQRQSTVLINVVNELLDLARIEARRGADFKLEACNLLDLLQQGAGDLVLPEGRSAPRLQALPDALPDAPPQGVFVRVDAGKALRVLANLLSNAYKYSPQHAGVELRPLLDIASGRAGFEVCDHGIGMSREQLARVGERFYRADPSGHVPGTGLGISIVREILALMGGRLELHSAPGAGTRAAVWLPLADAAVPTRAQATLATIAAT